MEKILARLETYQNMLSDDKREIKELAYIMADLIEEMKQDDKTIKGFRK